MILKKSTSSRLGTAQGPGMARLCALGRGLISFLRFGFSVMLGGIVALAILEVVLLSPQTIEKTRIVQLEAGESTVVFSKKLAQEGVIVHWVPFVLVTQGARFFGQSLRAGEYAFGGDISLWQVLRRIFLGQTVTYKITFPEGWTTHRMLERLAADPVLLPLSAGTVVREGELLPATYHFKRGKTADQLVADMRREHAQLLAQLWKGRPEGFPLQSPEEAVILASIVERETGVEGERPLVAGVFFNRLRLGMRLQSDPTVIYGITLGKKTLGRPLSKVDLMQETPYNTYRKAGLPPTPIANPGREALRAVFFPAPTEALYFVADGTGGHAFSKTLDEHNQNVKLWRTLKDK